MFEHYSFSLLHHGQEEKLRSFTTINSDLDELYSRNTSIIFDDLYEKIKKKYLLGVKINGLTSAFFFDLFAKKHSRSGYWRLNYLMEEAR